MGNRVWVFLFLILAKLYKEPYAVTDPFYLVRHSNAIHYFTFYKFLFVCAHANTLNPLTYDINSYALLKISSPEGKLENKSK